MYGILLFISSVALCFPYYIIGAGVCWFVWIVTKRWHIAPQVLFRSLFLSLLLAPGVVIGHGFVAVPAVLAVAYKMANRDRTDVGASGVLPIVVTWVGCAVVLSIIACFKRKKEGGPAPLRPGVGRNRARDYSS